MKQRISQLVFIFLLLMPSVNRAQGSWNPSGANMVNPRTILTADSVPVVRSRLLEADIYPLYSSVWTFANSSIPAGNSTDIERITRAMISKEAAFLYLIDRRPQNGNILVLTQTERDFLKARCISLLNAINTTVEVSSGFVFYNPWQHRSKDLISYLISYDLLLGAGVPAAELTTAKDKLIQFTANLYSRAMDTYSFGLEFFTYQINNHTIMTASALGLAAVVFNTYTNTNPDYQPVNWINAGLYNLDNTLWVENGTYPRVSEGDTLAGYAEGPAYLNYGFQNAFPFIRSMGIFLPAGNYSMTFNGNTRSIPNPWFDPRYDRLYDWMNKIRMPNGSSPPIHDSQFNFGTCIMALSGDPKFNLPNSNYSPNNYFVRTQYIASNVPVGTFQDSTFQALPEAGSLVFRSSWDSDAVYMHMIGKHGIALTGAKAHHQGDASSFTIAGYGEILAVDPGYASSSLSDLTNKAEDHSLILVNGTGPQPPSGEDVSTSTNTAYIENYFDTPLLDYGEVRTDYSGVNIVRKNLFLRNGYFIIGDFITSASNKNYTFQLHGHGLEGSASTDPTGAFTPNFSKAKGLYERNDSKLLVQVLASNKASSYSYATDSLALTSTAFRKYSKMLVSKNSSGNTTFLSVLYPHTGESPQVQPVYLSGSVVSTWISSGTNNDVAFCSYSGDQVTMPADSTPLGKLVKGNGKLNFYSETSAGLFSSVFMESGDSIRAGNQSMVVSSEKIDVAYQRKYTDFFEGYVSSDAVVKLYAPVPLQVAQGAVTSIIHDPSRQLSTVTFSAPGAFLLVPASVSWKWTGAKSNNWNDPQNWSIQTYPDIHGLPSATNDVLIPADAVTMPVISSGSGAACNNLTIEAAASLSVLAGKTITVNGNLNLLAD